MLLFCYSIWSLKIYDGKNKYSTQPKWKFNWVDTNYKRLQIKSLPFSQFRKLLSWLKSLLNFNTISAVNKVQGLYNRPLLINVILRDAKGPRIFPLDYGVMDKAETWAEIGQDDMEPLNKKHWYNTSACAITLSAHWTVFNSIYRPFYFMDLRMVSAFWVRWRHPLYIKHRGGFFMQWNIIAAW